MHFSISHFQLPAQNFEKIDSLLLQSILKVSNNFRDVIYLQKNLLYMYPATQTLQIHDAKISINIWWYVSVIQVTV